MATLKITQVRSVIKQPERTKRTMRALGLTKMHKAVEHDDNTVIRGMVDKVSHLVTVDEVK